MYCPEYKERCGESFRLEVRASDRFIWHRSRTSCFTSSLYKTCGASVHLALPFATDQALRRESNIFPMLHAMAIPPATKASHHARLASAACIPEFGLQACARQAWWLSSILYPAPLLTPLRQFLLLAVLRITGKSGIEPKTELSFLLSTDPCFCLLWSLLWKSHRTSWVRDSTQQIGSSAVAPGKSYAVSVCCPAQSLRWRVAANGKKAWPHRSFLLLQEEHNIFRVWYRHGFKTILFSFPSRTVFEFGNPFPFGVFCIKAIRVYLREIILQLVVFHGSIKKLTKTSLIRKGRW